MFVYPPEDFRLRSHPLGHQLMLKWSLPAILPAHYTIVIFKRLGGDISDAEITDYMLHGIIGSPSFEVITVAAGSKKYADFDVLNGSHYYYRASIRNDDASPPEWSDPYGQEIPESPPSSPPQYTQPAAADGIPAFTAVSVFPNAKALLITAVEIVRDNRTGLVLPNPAISEAAVYPHQNVGEMSFPAISIIRANQYFDAARVDAVQMRAFDIFSYNSVFQEFMGNQIRGDQKATGPSGADLPDQQGLIEQDNLLVIWRTLGPNQRDSISGSIRSGRAEILNYLHEHDVMETRTAMGTDFTHKNVDISGSPSPATVYGCSFMVQARFESRFTFASDQYVGDPVNESHPDEPPFQTQFNPYNTNRPL